MLPKEINQLTKEELLGNFWDYVKRSIELNGEKIFIATKTGSTTYKEANQRANAIYQVIKENIETTGIGIGLFMKDPHQIIPAMMGVLKSGNYFIPLDVTFPQSTLLDMIKVAEIKVVLTVSELKNQIRSHLGENIPILNIDTYPNIDEIEDPVVHYTPEDIVQILFTSGSTGKPKGAIEDYRYLTRAVFIKLSSYEYAQDERLLQTSKFTFAGPHCIAFTALINGITLCYYSVSEEGIAGLPDWIRQQQITSYSTTPTVFRSLVSILKPDDIFPSIRYTSFGGEKRFGNDIKAIKKYFPNVEKIRLGFNSTETQAVAATIYPANYGFDQNQLPSGKPYKDLHVFIWDKEGHALPKGQEGEIVVHGDFMARGYINNPNLTMEKFIPDASHPGWQFYKTGDLGKLLPDGQLVHLGRMDNMVKIRGMRVELDSIENHLLSYPGISEVASKAIEDLKGNKRLVTYFVSKEDTQIPIPDLRRYLAGRLPAHSLPHYLINLKIFPRTGNNKIAYDQLPPPEMIRPNLANELVPPADELEDKLLELWEDQLGIKGIGVTDDFFEVGGDSLMGALLFAAVEETLGRNLPVTVLLKAPTIREQAAWIRNKDSAQDTPSIIPVRTSGDRPPLFFIPGKGGYPTRIRHLAKKLDERIPIYACQDLMENENGNSFHSVESMAARYLREMEELYLHGPYILVGESVGGKIAYEVAQNLLSRGEQAPILILLDTYNFDDSAIEDFRNDQNSYYRMLVNKHLSILLRSNWQGKLDYLQFYRKTFIQKARRFIGRRINRKRQSTSTALPENIRRIEKANRIAAQVYETKPYPGKIVLIKALRGPKANETSNGWDKVQLGELVVHKIDCYHGSILFEPDVSQVAGIIQGLLE
jgi:amino acid adenylation domain-containing protein